MARKNSKTTIHDFTKQIHSTVRTGTKFAALDNHDEKKAKAAKKVCCHDCRYFDYTCREFLGKYHKTCKDFEWW